MSNKTTTPYITKYEKTKIIGKRAVQLSNGAVPLIDIKDMIDPLKIAFEEYKQKKIPIIIIRTLPDGRIEEWKLSDFKN